MMRNTRIFALVCTAALFALIPVLSQTITSKSSGGIWSDPNTWQGGVVPAQANDVVINGLVQIQGGVSCRNLTINAGATLQNTFGYDTGINVSGNITNNGALSKVASNWYLYVDVKGNITNAGAWSPYLVTLSGSANQTLSCSTSFDGPFQITDTLGQVLAGSSITLKSGFDMGKASFNLQNYPLTLDGAGSISNGRVLNTSDVTVRNNAALSNVTLVGSSITFRARANMSSGVVVEGNLTVADTLTNIMGADISTVIKGNLTNNGIVQNIVGNWWLYLTVSGNIVNNGIWTCHLTYLNGLTDQLLSQGSGKFFDGPFEVSDTLGQIVAASPLTFKNTVNLKNARFNFANNAVTLDGLANIYGGTVLNAADITVKNGAILSGVTYYGNLIIREKAYIGTGVIIIGNLTVADTMMSQPYADQVLTVRGNVTNNGVITNFASNWWLYMDVSGSVTNNGSWSPHLVYLSSKSNQQISQSAGKFFGGPFQVTDTAGLVIASSPLTLRAGFDLNKSQFDMTGKALTLEYGGGFTNGRVVNAGDITVRNGSVMSSVTYTGTIVLRNKTIVSAGVVFEGDVTNADTLQNDLGDFALTINGNITNNGIIQKYASNWYLYLDISGNITNNGIWSPYQTRLTGTTPRTVLAPAMQNPIWVTGSNVTFTGDNVIPAFNIDQAARCTLGYGATMVLTSAAISGKMTSYGRVTSVQKITTSSSTYTYFNSLVSVVPGGKIDSLSVQTYGNQVPSSFANAVKTWWRLTPKPASEVNSTESSLRLYYSDDILGSNDETQLQIYVSADSGKTWTQISTSLNLTRNTADNWVSIPDAPANGDYVLSSSGNPMTVLPSVIVSVLGRSQIRIGTPNRFTVEVFNNSDVSTDDFLIPVNLGTNAHLLSAEVPAPDGSVRTFPIDSISFAGEDSMAVFYATGMGPRETRRFDIIVRPDPPPSASPKIASPQFIDPFTITAGAVLIYVGNKAIGYVTTKAINYVGDYVNSTVELTPAEQAQYKQINGVMTKEVWEENRKDPIVAKPLKKISEKLISKVMGVTSWTVTTGKAVISNVGKIVPNLRRRFFLWAAKETGYFGVDEQVGDNTYNTNVAGGAQKREQPVRSFDPNEKCGPSGYGTLGYISSCDRMEYQILFENKKEATAPAYKIVIVDTLRSEFDSTSVQFGRTSHDGPAYNWSMTRTGNILRWSIEGIELPPNVNPPEGEGYVTFTVVPKKGLSSGTTLRNTSTVWFDMNPPITTNEYVNTLDFTPPQTQMKSIAQRMTSSGVVVRWQTSDGLNGSGIESVTVYACKDGGAYIEAGTTNADSLVVPVDPGSHRYSFYALAKDNVGNVEAQRPAVVTTDIVNGIENMGGKDIPSEFSLGQNYPNPFNPRTTISYSIPVHTRATLKVFDMLGREIASLVDEVKAPGFFRVEWDASKCASGVYFYRLQAESYVSTKKLILLK